jgi:transposase
MVIEPESKTCPCCGGDLHAIGEDVSKRLDKVPAKVRVIVTRRPKYACRTCEKTGADEVVGIIQAPAPARLVEGGLSTEAFVADVVVSKYADHQPLYRQSQILARQGVKIERSTLAQWVGAASAELQPPHDHLLGQLKASPKLFCDETRCPVLDPGRGKTKTGYLWAIARDDRPWGSSDPPAVAYAYAPGRGGVQALPFGPLGIASHLRGSLNRFPLAGRNHRDEIADHHDPCARKPGLIHFANRHQLRAKRSGMNHAGVQHFRQLDVPNPDCFA